MPIYDQTFRHYEGERKSSALWWPIARQTLRPIVKSKLTYLILMGVVVPVIVISVSFFVSAKFGDIIGQHGHGHNQAASSVAEASDVPLLKRNVSLNTLLFLGLYVEFATLWLLVAVRGGGIISVDKQNTALPLYFSRPLSIRDYILGKVLGLSILPAASLISAIMIIFLQAWAYFYSPAEAMRLLPSVVASAAYALLLSGFIALSMVAFSSLTKVSRTATITYLLFWFLSTPVSQMLMHATGNDATGAIAPSRALTIISMHMIRPEARWIRHNHEFRDFGLGVAIASIGLYSLFFILLIRRNLKIVEVVK